MEDLKPFLKDFQGRCHGRSRKWWVDMATGEPLERNKGELLALIHSELSECLEGIRKNLPDEKLPHRPQEEVELADAVMRIFDYAGGFDLDLAGAIVEKFNYNATRQDHAKESRQQPNGKKF